MRVSRFLPVLVAGAVFTATAAPASAATPGVGTTVGSLEVLSLDVGELLELDLLTDFAAANTDPDVDDAGAAAALKALVVDALVLPEPVELGVLDVASDGEEKTASNEGFVMSCLTRPTHCWTARSFPVRYWPHSPSLAPCRQPLLSSQRSTSSAASLASTPRSWASPPLPSPNRPTERALL